MSEASRARAEDSVSSRFTRIMNATTSRFGVLTDPSIVGIASAPPLVGLLAAVRFEGGPSLVLALEVLSAVPVTAAVAATIALSGARRQVIDWLAGLPFGGENMNAVLNGLGDAIEVSFVDSLPDVPALNVELDKVSPEVFVSKVGPEGREPEPGEARFVEIRIGIVDSKRNPSASNHARFVRVRSIVEQVLVPLHARHAIAEARVK